MRSSTYRGLLFRCKTPGSSKAIVYPLHADCPKPGTILYQGNKNEPFRPGIANSFVGDKSGFLQAVHLYIPECPTQPEIEGALFRTGPRLTFLDEMYDNEGERSIPRRSILPLIVREEVQLFETEHHHRLLVVRDPVDNRFLFFYRGKIVSYRTKDLQTHLAQRGVELQGTVGRKLLTVAHDPAMYSWGNELLLPLDVTVHTFVYSDTKTVSITRIG